MSSLKRNISDSFEGLIIEKTVRVIIQNGQDEVFDDVPKDALYQQSEHFKKAAEKALKGSGKLVAHQVGVEPWVFGVFDAWLRRSHDDDWEERSGLETCLIPQDLEYVRDKRSHGRLQRKINEAPKRLELHTDLLKPVFDHWYWLFSWQDLFALYEFSITYTNDRFQRAVLEDIKRRYNQMSEYILAQLPDSQKDIIRKVTKARFFVPWHYAADPNDLDDGKLDAWSHDVLSLSKESEFILTKLPALVVRSWKAYRCVDCKAARESNVGAVYSETDHRSEDAESPFRRLWCTLPFHASKHDTDEDKALCALKVKANRELKSVMV